MKAQSNDNTFRMMTMEIRKSKLSGKYFFQKWLPYPTRKLWRRAFRNLTNQEKITLIENIARLRLTCQNRYYYDQITQSCYYLEKQRLMQQIIRDFRERSIETTEQLINKSCLFVQSEATKRILELGLYQPFEEVIQINKSRKKAEVSQNNPSFSERFGQKLSKNEQPQKTSSKPLRKIQINFYKIKKSYQSVYPGVFDGGFRIIEQQRIGIIMIRLLHSFKHFLQSNITIIRQWRCLLKISYLSSSNQQN